MQRATRAALVKAAKRSKRLKHPLFVFSAHRAGKPTRFISTGSLGSWGRPGEGNPKDPTLTKDIYVLIGLVYPEGTASLMGD
jgi:hypothetical protein